MGIPPQVLSRHDLENERSNFSIRVGRLVAQRGRAPIGRLAAPAHGLGAVPAFAPSGWHSLAKGGSALRRLQSDQVR
jgi:hypothetical protein